ncbi:MAG: GntR family transcriptional regulator [Gemmatimonadetes bacterium]|nr:GntR family transcriptional regulator [Gemmatimonadota bacterium]MYG35353.1 GntR family transcriptional regulator [Gemmatimonadota bacterium]
MSLVNTTVDLGTQAYERLRELIVHGRLAPGSRLIETEIADRLGLSRTPIRSALQRLMQEGYIADTGNGRQSRPYVSPLTKDDALELLFIVGEIEGLAAWRAAQLDTRPALVTELNAINSEMLAEASLGRPSRERLFQLDNRFHRSYVQAGAGPRLLVLNDSIKPQAERYIRLYIDALIDQITVSVDEHERIVNAIVSGDPDKAQATVRTNWRNAAERLGGVIARAGELGSW